MCSKSTCEKLSVARDILGWIFMFCTGILIFGYIPVYMFFYDWKYDHIFDVGGVIIMTFSFGIAFIFSALFVLEQEAEYAHKEKQNGKYNN
jgi:hypothetical protein